MSKRVVGSKAAAGLPLRSRTPTFATPLKTSDKPNVDVSSSDSPELFSFWTEGGDQLANITSGVTILSLYGVMLYTPTISQQSVQLVVATTLFAISLLNFRHYMGGRQKRIIADPSIFSGYTNIPPYIKQSSDGTFYLSSWYPTKFTENVFLNFNPLTPILGYIWCRSFEPFAGWLCVGLMVLLTGLLHLLMTRMKFLLKQEQLLSTQTGTAQYQQFPEESMDANKKSPKGSRYARNNRDYQSTTKRSDPYEGLELQLDTPSRRTHQPEPQQPISSPQHRGYDQTPQSHAYRSPTAQHNEQEAQNWSTNTQPSATPSQDSYPQFGRGVPQESLFIEQQQREQSHVTPARNQPQGQSSVHIERPLADQGKTPSRTPFGLRYAGAGTRLQPQEEPQIRANQNSSATPHHHRSVHQQQQESYETNEYEHLNQHQTHQAYQFATSPMEHVSTPPHLRYVETPQHQNQSGSSPLSHHTQFGASPLPSHSPYGAPPSSAQKVAPPPPRFSLHDY